MDWRHNIFAAAKAENLLSNHWRDSNMKKMFLVIYTPGPAWIPGRSVFEQPLEPHGRYVQKRYREGKVRMAGPFTDSRGGASLLEVEGGAAEARAIADNDPAVLAGIFTAEIYPWHLVAWDSYSGKET